MPGAPTTSCGLWRTCVFAFCSAPEAHWACPVVNCAYGYQEKGEVENEEKGVDEKSAEEAGQEKPNPQEEISEKKEDCSEEGGRENEARKQEENRPEKAPRPQEAGGQGPDPGHGGLHSRRPESSVRRPIGRLAGIVQP